jgi:preprotein translocase subunit SecD
MHQFPKWKLILIFLTCAVLTVVALPNFVGIKSSYLPSKKVNYGLDLKGGSQLLLKVDFKAYVKDQLDITSDLIRKSLRKEGVLYLNLKVEDNKITLRLKNPEDKDKALKAIKKTSRDLDNKISKDGYVSIGYSAERLTKLQELIVEQAREIIRHRIDETGTLEPSITRYGDLGILLQVPGLHDPDQLKRILGKTAQLTFNMVDEQHSIDQARKGIVPLGLKLLPGSEDDNWYLVTKKAALSGNMLTDAQLSNSNGQSVVSISFNSMGAKIFAELTRKNRGKRMAIVLDDKVISAPSINEPIVTGSGIISGSFTVNSANELALLLRAGSLPAPLVIAEEKTVGPSLGEDSIELGKKSALISLIVVIVFMIATYGIYGAFASVALIFNIIFILAIMSLLQATLTMPGIAGIVLTMGMAVDANVLIFERIREELKLKSSPEYAITRGFKQAFATIIDSNLTTLIAAFFLYAFGSGIVKGFAVTLTIGILSSMFTAITLTRILIFFWLNMGASKKATI